MYVERIEGTVKGAVNTNLGQRTLIVGPNGSGKSRIVNTLELALLGYASDVVGRAEMRKEGELIALAAGDDLTARAILSDGRVCEWGTKKTKTGAKRAEHVKAVHAEFPVSMVREALTGSVETARKWLLQRIAATVSRADVVKYLVSDESEALYQTKAKWVQGSEVDVLLAVYESAKTEKRSKATQQTTTAKSISALADGLAAEPTEAQLAAAQQAADDAMRAYRAAVEANALASVATAPDTRALDALYARAAEIAGLHEFAAQSLRNAEARLAALGGPLTPDAREIHDLRASVIHVSETQARASVPVCFVCENPHPTQRAAERAKHFHALNGNMNDRETAEADVFSAAEVEAAARQKFEQILADYNTAKATQAAHVPADAHHVAGTEQAVTDAADALRAANDANATLNRTAGSWKSVRSLKQEEREAKKAIGVLEELIEGCKAAVEGILKSATDAFIAKVQSFLPASDAFTLELNDGEREVCRFGFVRDGNLHTALSGAEWARLTLALACATASEATGVLRVFVPEDRAFDPHTLRAVLEALSDAPGQVIIATTTKPAGRMPKGWTLVETGATE